MSGMMDKYQVAGAVPELSDEAVSELIFLFQRPFRKR